MRATKIQSFAGKRCISCEVKTSPLTKAQAKKNLTILKGWKLSRDFRVISRSYAMKSFLAAVHLIQQIALIAETEGHHPDIHLMRYRHLRVDISTHAIGGLSENDFILAAKIDQIPKSIRRNSN
ncbi:MAG: 4a-hydroxytetrahydrobiopterin dehydratase [Candidatus Omnitrophica bacterium]|nr:4a-hydroxytetrahydrobiopterin dehydratase [Candidatus Omnitrophota bacterium]MDD5671411.1 4a-hydroxytetrahydrobiopterin dehydratase [Candidatus Omnitrophota bacterium]